MAAKKRRRDQELSAPAAEDDMFAMALPVPEFRELQHPEEHVVFVDKARQRKDEKQRARPLETHSAGEAVEGYVPKTITCRDCGSPFVFSAKQQHQLAVRGFGNVEKTRCDGCAQFKKNRLGRKADDKADDMDVGVGPEATNSRGKGIGRGDGKGIGRGDGKGKGRGDGKGKGRGSGGEAGASRKPKLCDAFQLGACNRGSSCKFMHLLAKYRDMIDWQTPL